MAVVDEVPDGVRVFLRGIGDAGERRCGSGILLAQRHAVAELDAEVVVNVDIRAGLVGRRVVILTVVCQQDAVGRRTALPLDVPGCVVEQGDGGLHGEVASAPIGEAVLTNAEAPSVCQVIIASCRLKRIVVNLRAVSEVPVIAVRIHLCLNFPIQHDTIYKRLNGERRLTIFIVSYGRNLRCLDFFLAAIIVNGGNGDVTGAESFTNLELFIWISKRYLQLHRHNLFPDFEVGDLAGVAEVAGEGAKDTIKRKVLIGSIRYITGICFTVTRRYG